MNWFLQCTECRKRFPLEPGRYLCDVCGAKQEPDRPLRGILECRWEETPLDLGTPGLSGSDASGYSTSDSSASGYSTSDSSASGYSASDAGASGSGVPVAHRGTGNPGPTFSMEDLRWEDWLPVGARSFPPIPVGHTPLWEPERLREATGFPNLYIKDDTCEPSGSFKDRASFLVAAFALERGIREIALASTGNAASSMAAVGAASHINIRVFLPKKAPMAKRIQVLQYGADLTEVAGTYDVAFEQSLAYSRETGVLSRNTAYNPLTIEGKKTVSFEIASQLAELGKTADHIFVPLGDGVILAGLYKGFEDLLRLGVLERMPTIWACQAEGSSAIARSFFRLLELGAGKTSAAPHREYTTAPAVFSPEIFHHILPSDTLADSISVDVPRNGYHALGKLQAYGGWPVVVTDREILLAQRNLASHTGLFAEPSSSAAWAGFVKIIRKQTEQTGSGAATPRAPAIGRNETVVILITGSGLKDTAGALKALEIEQ